MDFGKLFGSNAPKVQTVGRNPVCCVSMPPKIEQWFFAHHARARQRERGITEDEIKDAVLTDRSWIQGKGARGGVKWAFEKVIDGDTLRVAGEVKGNGIYVVTAFWVGK